MMHLHIIMSNWAAACSQVLKSVPSSLRPDRGESRFYSCMSEVVKSAPVDDNKDQSSRYARWYKVLVMLVALDHVENLLVWHFISFRV